VTYDTAVPHSYRLVNDRDIVTGIPKLISLFKHVGREIVIDKRGNLITDFTFVEKIFRTQRNIRDHLMDNYRCALLAVIKQHDVEYQQNGMWGILNSLKIPEEQNEKQLGAAMSWGEFEGGEKIFQLVDEDDEDYLHYKSTQSDMLRNSQHPYNTMNHHNNDGEKVEAVEMKENLGVERINSVNQEVSLKSPSHVIPTSATVVSSSNGNSDDIYQSRTSPFFRVGSVKVYSSEIYPKFSQKSPSHGSYNNNLNNHKKINKNKHQSLQYSPTAHKNPHQDKVENSLSHSYVFTLNESLEISENVHSLPGKAEEEGQEEEETEGSAWWEYEYNNNNNINNNFNTNNNQGERIAEARKYYYRAADGNPIELKDLDLSEEEEEEEIN
jgi:hypothetical protein